MKNLTGFVTGGFEPHASLSSFFKIRILVIGLGDTPQRVLDFYYTKILKKIKRVPINPDNIRVDSSGFAAFSRTGRVSIEDKMVKFILYRKGTHTESDLARIHAHKHIFIYLGVFVLNSKLYKPRPFTQLKEEFDNIVKDLPFHSRKGAAPFYIKKLMGIIPPNEVANQPKDYPVGEYITIMIHEKIEVLREAFTNSVSGLVEEFLVAAGKYIGSRNARSKLFLPEELKSGNTSDRTVRKFFEKGRSYKHFADILVLMGNIDDAKDLLNRAMKYSDESRDTVMEAACWELASAISYHAIKTRKDLSDMVIGTMANGILENLNEALKHYAVKGLLARFLELETLLRIERFVVTMRHRFPEIEFETQTESLLLRLFSGQGFSNRTKARVFVALANIYKKYSQRMTAVALFGFALKQKDTRLRDSHDLLVLLLDRTFGAFSSRIYAGRSFDPVRIPSEHRISFEKYLYDNHKVSPAHSSELRWVNDHVAWNDSTEDEGPQEAPQKRKFLKKIVSSGSQTLLPADVAGTDKLIPKEARWYHIIQFIIRTLIRIMKDLERHELSLFYHIHALRLCLSPEFENGFLKVYARSTQLRTTEVHVALSDFPPVLYINPIEHQDGGVVTEISSNGENIFIYSPIYEKQRRRHENLKPVLWISGGKGHVDVWLSNPYAFSIPIDKAVLYASVVGDDGNSESILSDPEMLPSGVPKHTTAYPLRFTLRLPVLMPGDSKRRVVLGKIRIWIGGIFFDVSTEGGPMFRLEKPREIFLLGPLPSIEVGPPDGELSFLDGEVRKLTFPIMRNKSFDQSLAEFDAGFEFTEELSIYEEELHKSFLSVKAKENRIVCRAIMNSKMASAELVVKYSDPDKRYSRTVSTRIPVALSETLGIANVSFHYIGSINYPRDGPGCFIYPPSDGVPWFSVRLCNICVLLDIRNNLGKPLRILSHRNFLSDSDFVLSPQCRRVLVLKDITLRYDKEIDRFVRDSFKRKFKSRIRVQTPRDRIEFFRRILEYNVSTIVETIEWKTIDSSERGGFIIPRGLSISPQDLHTAIFISLFRVEYDRKCDGGPSLVVSTGPSFVSLGDLFHAGDSIVVDLEVNKEVSPGGPLIPATEGQDFAIVGKTRIVISMTDESLSPSPGRVISKTLLRIENISGGKLFLCVYLKVGKTQNESMNGLRTVHVAAL